MELTRSVTRPFSIRWPMRALIWICPPWGSSRPGGPGFEKDPVPCLLDQLLEGAVPRIFNVGVRHSNERTTQKIGSTSVSRG